MTSKIISLKITALLSEISEAASQSNIPKVQKLTDLITELQRLQSSSESIEKRFASLSEGEAQKHDIVKDSHLRVLPVEVTKGMLNQNLLTLTDHVNQNTVKHGDEFVILSIPNERLFRTNLLANGNRLKERSAIREFYEAAKVVAGDFVTLTETAPNRWRLEKAPAGHFKGRYNIEKLW